MNSKTVLICVMILFVLVSGTIYFTYTQKENGLYYSIEKSENETMDEKNSLDITSQNSKDSSLNQGMLNKSAQGDLDVSPSSSILEAGQETNGIFVYIYGAVVKEGVYEVPFGSRVYEALSLTGGVTQEAASGFVNLARPLVDGESIYFPTKGEELNLIVEAQDIDDGLIDINHASESELVELPGIGEAKAKSIIAYRKMNGSFTTIEDIMKVSGIKESLFLTIKDRIKV